MQENVEISPQIAPMYKKKKSERQKKLKIYLGIQKPTKRTQFKWSIYKNCLVILSINSGNLFVLAKVVTSVKIDLSMKSWTLYRNQNMKKKFG